MTQQTLKPVSKLTPRMLKEIAKVSSDDQDYAILYYFTENTFSSFEESKQYWENEDIMLFGKTLQTVMKAIQPKLDKFNNLNDKLQGQG